MLILQQTTPCFFAFHKERLPLRRFKSYSLRTRATQQEDDHPQNKPQDFQSSWDDHLKIQSKQADSYRPPAFKNQEIQASGEKFLGRLAVLILGVSHEITLNNLDTICKSCKLKLDVNMLQAGNCRLFCLERGSQAMVLCNH